MRERARRAKNKHLSEGDRRHQKRALLPYSEFINSREPNVPQLISRCPMSEPLSTYVSCGSLGACGERNPRPHLVVNTVDAHTRTEDAAARHNQSLNSVKANNRIVEGSEMHTKRHGPNRQTKINLDTLLLRHFACNQVMRLAILRSVFLSHQFINDINVLFRLGGIVSQPRQYLGSECGSLSICSEVLRRLE